MDRRQQRTRTAVFDALSRLLQRKHFDDITVQEIIDAANIGRSTFYSHFETKDDLLKTLCAEIFEHIFEPVHTQEPGHDFSGSRDELSEQLAHVLYHLRDNRCSVAGILEGESGDRFLRYFKSYLVTLFEKHRPDFPVDVPEEFKMNFLAGSFSDTVRWWVGDRMKLPPETVILYFAKCISYTEICVDLRRRETIE